MFVLLMVTSVQAKDVTLSWDRSPTEKVTGYKLYWATNSRITEFDRTSVDCGDVLRYEITGLPDNLQHWFAATAYDNIDNESVYSNIVTSPAISESLPDLELSIEWQLLMEGG